MRIRPTKMMSIAMQNRIIAAIKRMFPEEYPIFALMDEVGLRLAEVFALDTEDFIQAPPAIIVRTSTTKPGLKSRRTRVIPLSSGLGNLIGELANRSDSDTNLRREAHSDPRPLFVNPTSGKPWTTQHLLHNVWEPVLLELGIDLARMIELRHASVIRQLGN